MKWIVLSLIVSLFTYFTAWAIVSRRAEMTTYPGEVRLSLNQHSEQLNACLTENLLEHLPKDRSYVVKDFEPFTNLHGLIKQSDCSVSLTDFKTNDQVEALKIAFQYYQGYIDTLNNTREARPYLYDFPVSITMCSFALRFAHDPQTKLSYPAPYLASVLFMGAFGKPVSIVQYAGGGYFSKNYTDVYDNCLGAFPDELQAMNTPRFDKMDNQKPIAISQATKYFAINDSAKDEFFFAQKFAKENGLKFIAYMNAFDLEKPKDKRVCSFLTYAGQEMCLSLDQARELVMKTRNEHVVFYNQWGVLPNYVNGARKSGLESLSPIVDAQKYLGFRLSFWDKYIDRVKAPFIAEVRVYGKRARYYVADELQRLQLIHEEELPNYDLEVPVPEDLNNK